jgi:NAD(P)-dependent dehydrogenase (short-subunit alcohol dehydrogenase family)
MDRSCRFDGKSVIVTGAGMGIGRGTAVAFAREGGCVIVADISGDAADDTVREITSQGGKAISVTCAVS